MIKNTKPMVSIIIVNFNGEKYLYKCISSIEDKVSVTKEVIVVDNKSNDNSVDIIRNKFPSVVLIENLNNVGFASGNNIGASVSKGKYLLLLNNDTKIVTDIKKGIEILEEDETIGIIGAKMMGRDNEYLYSAGHFPDLRYLFVISSMYEKKGNFKDGAFPENDLVYAVDWVEGSFLLTRKYLWMKTGGLDSSYFMYGEDVDYCKRARELGYFTVYFPGIEYVHYSGYDDSRYPLIFNGLTKFHHKHSSNFKCNLAKIILKSGTLGRLLISSVILPVRNTYQRRMRIKSCINYLLNGAVNN